MKSTAQPVLVLLTALVLPWALFFSLAAAGQGVVPIEPVAGIVEGDTLERVTLEPRPPAARTRLQPAVPAQGRSVAVLPGSEVR